MNEHVDPQAMQAALALCMLLQDTRYLQQIVDPEETEDEDRTIIHVRPVVHRRHPYQGPETQQRPARPLRRLLPDTREPDLRRSELPHAAGVTTARSTVSLDAGSSGVPEPVTVQQLAPARHPLPDRRPSPRHSLPDERPSPAQSPSDTEDDTSPVNQYTLRSVIFQTLLAAPAGQWLLVKDVADYVMDKYPQLFKTQDERACRDKVAEVLRNNLAYLERSVAVTKKRLNQWRLAEGVRHAVTIMAWKTMQPARTGWVLPSIPYSHRAVTLQALLAAPEGRLMRSSEVVDYLVAQYPQLLERGRYLLSTKTTTALRECGSLCERVVLEDERKGTGYWRLSPGAREEATRLAWRKKAVWNAAGIHTEANCEPE